MFISDKKEQTSSKKWQYVYSPPNSWKVIPSNHNEGEIYKLFIPANISKSFRFDYMIYDQNFGKLTLAIGDNNVWRSDERRFGDWINTCVNTESFINKTVDVVFNFKAGQKDVEYFSNRTVLIHNIISREEACPGN